jgi:hypothetical protein
VTHEELATTRAMMDHGGSFVRTLAVAYTVGDAANRAKIRETWPDYWIKYSDPMLQKKPAPQPTDLELLWRQIVRG